MGYSVFHAFDSRRSAAGWPDIVACKPPRILFVELKVGRYQPTEEQLRWLHLLGECGLEAYVMRSTGDRVEDAKGIADVLREKPKAVAA